MLLNPNLVIRMIIHELQMGGFSEVSIILLNPTLTDGVALPLPTYIAGPWAIWLNESVGRLYVGERDGDLRVLIFDNVFNLGSAFSL